MSNCELSVTEQKRRKKIAEQTRAMIKSQLNIEDEDDASVMTNYRGYYLQISFSNLHPLMVFCLAKPLSKPSSAKQRQMTNNLNLGSILGSHAINDDAGCYSYRATHWLDTQIDSSRFFEILDRCIEESDRGIRKLIG